MPTPGKDVVLTTKEAMQYLRISKPTLLKYIRFGRIRATKAGNGWRVHQSELHRFVGVEEIEEKESTCEPLSSPIYCSES